MRLKNWARRAGKRIARTVSSWPSNLGVGIGLYVSHLFYEKWAASHLELPQGEEQDDGLTLDVNAALGAAIPDPLDETSSEREVFTVADPLPEKPPADPEEVVTPPDSEGSSVIMEFDGGEDILSYLVPSSDTGYALVADYQVYTLEYVEPQEPMYSVQEEDDDDDKGLFWLDPAAVLAVGLGFFAGTRSYYDFDVQPAADNTSPLALIDGGSVDEDATLAVDAAHGVLSNDTDGDGDGLSVTALRTGTESGYGSIGTVGEALTGTYGTLTLSSDGSYTYTADQTATDALGEGESATDSFTYQVSDGQGGTDLAQLDITVSGVNDAPTSSDDSVVSNEGTTIVLSLDDFGTYTDVDGDSVAGVKISSLPSAGSLEYSADGSTWMAVSAGQEISTESIDGGRLRFVPEAGASGDDYASIGFEVYDGAAYSEGGYVLSVDINTLPSSTDDSVTTDEDVAYAFTLEDFGAFSDADGDVLAAVKISTLPTGGTLEYSSDGVAWETVPLDQEISTSDIEAGRLRYTPPADLNGTPYTTIGFQVSDGSSYSSSDYTLTVNVTSVNDVPTSTDDSVTTEEDVAVLLAVSDLGSFTDVDGDLLAGVRITTLPVAGTLEYSSDGTTWTAVSDSQEISTSDIEAGRLRYTPVADAYGVPYASLGFEVYDGVAYSSSEYTLTLNVSSVNDAPSAADDTVTMDEDTFVVLLADDFGTFSDVDGDSFAGVRITALESAGDLEYYDGSQWVDVVADQLISASDIDAWNLRYTPADDAYGTPYATIGFEVYDGTDYSASEYTLSVNVSAVNDMPAVDLKPLDDSGIDNTATFVEVAGTDDGSAAVAFAAEGVNLSDVDSANLTSLTVSIASSTVESGDRLVLGSTVIDLSDTSDNVGEVSYDGTAFSYSVTDAGEDRTVVFTSLVESGGEGAPAVISSYELLLDALKFNNTADDVTSGETRTFSVVASDGTDSSDAADFTVTLQGTDDPSDLIFDMSAGPFIDDGTVVVNAYTSAGELLFSIEKIDGAYEIVGADAEDVQFIGEGAIIDTKIISGTEVVVVEEFQVRLFHYFGDVFLSLESGSYVDEATGATTALDVALRAVVDVPENSVSEVSVTPYTESAVRLIELAAGVEELSFDVAADAELISTYYAAAASGISELVGIDIVSTRATPVNDESDFLAALGEDATDEDIESNQYGLKLAALSELVASDDQLASKVDYGVSSIVDGLEVTFNDLGGLDFDLISFTTTQVELTDSFTDYNSTFTYTTTDNEGNTVTNPLVPLDDNGNPVAGSTLVRDAVAPETASIRLINPESGAFFMRGYVDLVDSLNAAEESEYLEFKLIFDDVQYTATYNEELGLWQSSSYDADTRLTNSSDSTFTITSFDASTGEASWQFLLPEVVTTGTYETILVLTDRAENASLVVKSFTITDGPPELFITIADPVLYAGETTTVTFDFSEEVTGFDLTDVFCFDTVSGLQQDALDPTLWTATLEVSSSQGLAMPMVVSVGDGAVLDRTGNENTTGASAVYTVMPSSPIVGDITMIDDTLWGTASADVIDGLTGDDILYGEGGDDLLLGHEQDDVLMGGEGDDTFLAGDGDDIVSGGYGDDIYYADAFGDFTYTQNYVVGGEGEDTVYFHYGMSEYKIAFVSASQFDFLNTLLGDEAGFRGITEYDLSFEEDLPVLRIERVDNFWEDLSGQVDYVQVEEYVFADAILQFTAVTGDLVFGTGWVLNVASADGALLMDGAYDPLQTTIGIKVEGSLYGDRLIGGLGDDVLAGGGGDDVIVSLGGDDHLYGGTGDDVLIATTAWTGADPGEVVLNGGEGADTFVFLPQDPEQGASLVIEDFSIDERDLIDITGFYHESTGGLQALTAADLVNTDFMDDYSSYLNLDDGAGYASLHLEGFVDADGEALADVDVRIDFDPANVPDTVSSDWFAPVDSGVLSEHWWDQLYSSLAN
ncbi:MAG: hypothetical protein A3K90_02100 [Pelodictyon luteolum]|uniref:Uncharacterized protein n=1 Tax=Pelodictyon luteolum TaxID=1100 RepID=A0A165LX08_PELLU|nr:Ig-like domain-containing protein [Pelodictyon luteolum]KZK74535.1 MAG: hypothetical protein A3K90_02100 [Pelodictyon luteolum]